MPPILHLMRHGQGYHSVSENGHQLRDPELTAKGREQCLERCRKFTRHDQVEVLLASPLRRALQTCQLTMSPSLARGLTIIAVPHAEEASGDPCDTGSELEILVQEFPSGVDFDHVKHGWYEHEGEFLISTAALKARAKTMRRFIRDRGEKEVVLVSHGFFNHYLTGDVDAEGKQTTEWWRETECRTFEFVEGDEEARIVETEESVKGREREAEEEGPREKEVSEMVTK